MNVGDEKVRVWDALAGGESLQTDFPFDAMSRVKCKWSHLIVELSL